MTRVSMLLFKEDTFPGARGKSKLMGGAASCHSQSARAIWTVDKTVFFLKFSGLSQSSWKVGCNFAPFRIFQVEPVEPVQPEF